MSALSLKFPGRDSSDQLGLALAVSLAAHLVLLAALAFWPGWPGNRRETFAPMYQVQLVGAQSLAPAAPSPKPASAPAAPKPAPKPEPKLAPKPAPKPEPAKEAVGLKKDQPKTKRIEPKKEAPPAPDVNKLIDAKVQRLKGQVAEQRRLDSAISRLESKVADKGGAYASGGANAVPSRLSLAYQIYYTEIWERVRRHWVLPETVVEDPRGLQAVVAVRINRDGSLAKFWLEQGSGNPRFDQSCLKAVERATPFPPLPAGNNSSTHEVGLRFIPADAGA